MAESHPDHPDHPDGTNPDRVREDLAELADLIAIGIEVDGQVLQVAASTWAIYGHSSYDGEIIVGSTLSCREGGAGFFVTPADTESNNVRLFVVSTATRSVRFL